MTDMDWAVPGAKAAIYSWRGGWGSEGTATLTTVERLTATQIVVKGARGDLKFRRDNGRAVGSDHGELRPRTDVDVRRALAVAHKNHLNHEIDKAFRESQRGVTAALELCDEIQRLVVAARSRITALAEEN